MRIHRSGDEATKVENSRLLTSFNSQSRVKVEYRLPLSEVVTDFFPRLKQLSSGYASFDYEEAGYDEAKLVKVMSGQKIESNFYS